MIKLYGMSSPNVLKIMIALEEFGLSYDFVHVDLFSEGQFHPDFLALNSNSKVPVLVDQRGDDNQPIFESGAILQYLAEVEGKFLPAAGPARYAVIKWLTLQVSTVGPLLGQLNHFCTYAPKGEDYSVGRYSREAMRIYTMLDQRLATSANLAGPEYSIADMATLPWTDYFERQSLPRADFPHIQRWRDELEARPAVARARAAMVLVQQRDGAMFSAGSEAARRRFIGLGKD
jgi:GST-like protein